MDNFIDKFAQRKNAQEIIRANAMAEAKEREKLQSKLSEYELAMQEMRQCSLQNMENAEKVKELLETSLNKINAVQEKDAQNDEASDRMIGEVRALLEDLKGQVGNLLTAQKEETEAFWKEQSALIMEQNTQTRELVDSRNEALEEKIKATEDFTHREAVKVYRNVQAVIEGALPKQTAEITESVKKLTEKGKAPGGLMAVGVLTFLAAAANLVIEVLRILGYL